MLKQGKNFDNESASEIYFVLKRRFFHIFCEISIFRLNILVTIIKLVLGILFGSSKARNIENLPKSPKFSQN